MVGTIYFWHRSNKFKQFKRYQTKIPGGRGGGGGAMGGGGGGGGAGTAEGFSSSSSSSSDDQSTYPADQSNYFMKIFLQLNQDYLQI